MQLSKHVAAGVQTVNTTGPAQPYPTTEDEESRENPSDERLPACIVMEKGECLTEYLSHRKDSLVDDQQLSIRVRSKLKVSSFEAEILLSQRSSYMIYMCLEHATLSEPACEYTLLGTSLTTSLFL